MRVPLAVFPMYSHWQFDFAFPAAPTYILQQQVIKTAHLKTLKKNTSQQVTAVAGLRYFRNIKKHSNNM